MGPSHPPSLQSAQLLGSQGLFWGKVEGTSEADHYMQDWAWCGAQHSHFQHGGGLCPSPSGQADWDGVIKQNMEEEPQGAIVTAVAETWAPKLHILHVIRRMSFNTLVRANLQRLVVIVMNNSNSNVLSMSWVSVKEEGLL